jgi:hypothetical protein
MRRHGLWLIIVILAILNLALLWRAESLSTALEAAISEHRSEQGERSQDALDPRGVYTLPTFGQYFMSPETAAVRVSLNMVVFLPGEIDCPYNVQDLANLKELLPLFRERGQRMVAVCDPPDSAEIIQVLDSVGLNIPLTPVESEQFTFRQMGISPDFMPFKVFYDSNYTAVYMRGANNSEQSQTDFMRAARRLSRLAWEGNL